MICQFVPDAPIHSLQTLSGGLINQTIKVGVGTDDKLQYFVLQKLNTRVFLQPFAVVNNFIEVSQSIDGNYPLQLPVLISTHDGLPLYHDANGHYWRLFSWLENTISYTVPPSSDTICLAGNAYGTLLYALRDINLNRLEETIPHFHDLQFRFDQLQGNLLSASSDRRLKSQRPLNQIVMHFERFSADFTLLPKRAVHNDCKLANLLFDQTTGECRAVIDFDTVMTGVIVTDFGDMVRSLCCTASEEERSLERVAFDPVGYSILKSGFLRATHSWLTRDEKLHLFDGAIYIVLEQAIRFLADYLHNDAYYGCSYPDHNYNRACNQLSLLDSMCKQGCP